MGSLTHRGRQGLNACTLQPSRFPGWKRLICTLPIEVAVRSSGRRAARRLPSSAGGAR